MIEESNFIQKENRIEWIDGIKGLACIIVIFAHFCQAFYPELINITEAAPFSYKIIGYTPLNIFINGNFGVQIFFVLTGYLSARKISSNKKPSILIGVYFRLLKIVLPAVLFAGLLMKMHLMFHLNDNTFESIFKFNNFTPSFIDCLYDAFIRTFFISSKYVGPLWTIHFSLFGTLLAIGAISYANLLTKTSFKVVVYLSYSMIVFNLSPQMISFILGALVYDCTELLKGRAIGNSKYAIALIGVYLACINKTCLGFYKPLCILLNVYERFDCVIRAIGISMCLVFIDQSRLIKGLLSKRFPSEIGHISMYCYSFHWPIILSAGCGLYILLKKYIPYRLLSIILFGIVLLITIAFSKTILSFETEVKRRLNRSKYSS